MLWRETSDIIILTVGRYLVNQLMKKLTKAILVASIIVGVFFIWFSVIRSGCKRLTCLSMINLGKFKVKEIYQENDNLFWGLLSSGDFLLRAEVSSSVLPEDAEKEIKQQVLWTQSLFETAPAPYPGEISDRIVCSRDFVPKITSIRRQGGDFTYVKLFLNDRLVAGACNQDLVSYENTLVLFYCPQTKQLFKVELIIPKKDTENLTSYDKMLDSLACKQK